MSRLSRPREMVRIDEAARLDWNTEELGAHWDELKLGSLAGVHEPFLKSSWKRFKPLAQKLRNYIQLSICLSCLPWF